MLLYIFFHVLSGQPRRIQRATRRSRGGTDKRLHFGDEIVAAAVDLQQVAQLHVLRIRASGERQIELQTVGITLPPINLFDIIRGIHQFVNELNFSWAEALLVERHIDGLKSREAGVQVWDSYQIRY